VIEMRIAASLVAVVAVILLVLLDAGALRNGKGRVSAVDAAARTAVPSSVRTQRKKERLRHHARRLRAAATKLDQRGTSARPLLRKVRSTLRRLEERLSRAPGKARLLN
jgi:hypothetical protein